MALRLSCWHGNLLRQTRATARLAYPSNPCRLTSISSHPTHVMVKELVSTPHTAHTTHYMDLFSYRAYSTESESAESAKSKSSIQKIKVILREYGTVAVVFHTVMSLGSLGTCYLLVSNGLPVEKILAYLNVTSSGASKGASTFAISYVLHKVLLPVRATITVAGVPLIVRKLRAMGWMKGGANKQLD